MTQIKVYRPQIVLFGCIQEAVPRPSEAEHDELYEAFETREDEIGADHGALAAGSQGMRFGDGWVLSHRLLSIGRCIEYESESAVSNKTLASISRGQDAAGA